VDEDRAEGGPRGSENWLPPGIVRLFNTVVERSESVSKIYGKLTPLTMHLRHLWYGDGDTRQ
jgi:hypothetical protein